MFNHVIIYKLSRTECDIVLHNLEKVSDTVFKYFLLLQLWSTDLFTINKTVHCMHFSASYYLPPFFIKKLFTGFFFRFSCYSQVPFFRFPCYSQAPCFDLHAVYKLPFPIYTLFSGSFFVLHVTSRLLFSIYVLFSGSLFRFPCYFQALFFVLHVIYSLLFRYTCYLHDLIPLLWKFIVFPPLFTKFRLEYFHVFTWIFRNM